MFKYSFNSRHTLLTQSEYSFKKIKANDFLQNILFPLSKYMNYKWDDIKKLDHWHLVTEDILQKKCPTILELTEGSEKIFQLALTGKSRILGFISNDIFNIVAYDKNHTIYK